MNKVVLIVFGLLSIIIGVLYFSPLNVIRNITSSFSQNNTRDKKVLPPDTVVCSSLSIVDELWSKKDEELYEEVWNTSHVETRALNPLGSSNKERYRYQKNSQLNTYEPRLSEKEIGYEYLPYAGVAAGDINQDGFLDVVLTKGNQKMRIMINDRAGDFIDVTGCVFPNMVPEDVEHISLADFNNDSYMDLLIGYSQYKKERKNAIYYFNHNLKSFSESSVSFGESRRSIGGVTVADLNKDKFLDFYLSYGANYYSNQGIDDQPAERYTDELYVSDGKKGWKEQVQQYFPSSLSTAEYAGMTSLFTDFNRDGAIDFLLGNDYTDPSMTLLGNTEGYFNFIQKEAIENNTRDSMSYYTLDFNNDGVFELWENGIARRPSVGRASNSVNTHSSSNPLNDNTLNEEIVTLIKNKELGKFDCGQYSEFYVNTLCWDFKWGKQAMEQGDIELCENLSNDSTKAICRRIVNTVIGRSLVTFNEQFVTDSEKFPKQIAENSLLKLDKAGGSYKNLKVNTDVEYTGWTWAAYPFDVNNDGYQDMYITNGWMISLHDINHLLINESSKDTIALHDKAVEYGVDIEDESRGVIIADFSNTGAGDIVVNNVLTAPKYFRNMMGGQAIEVELRSKNSNYYAVGAQVELHTEKTGIQLREIRQGGIWGSAQPFRQHFGIPEGDSIKQLKIRWPDGHEQSVKDIKPNNLYVIYE